MKRSLLFSCLVWLCQLTLLGQGDRFGVIGSSTAAGVGVPASSSWTHRIKSHYMALGVIDTLYNIAQSATSCYTGMPTGYSPPAGRPAPDPNLNITRVLSFNPKPTVVIVNYPTNGYDSWSIEEILFCLQTIKNEANSQNVDCYITTTQPRDNFPFAVRQKLVVIRDSILLRFGDKAIDFWTPIGDLNTLGILPQYALGDFIHINAEGHALLANKVIEKDIFSLQAPLPVHFESFTGIKKGTGILLKWTASGETRNSYYSIEKSSDGVGFQKIADVPVMINGSPTNHYQFLLSDPSIGANYFRIRHTEVQGEHNFSRTIKIFWNEIELSLGTLFPNPAGNQISFTVEANRDYWVEVTVEDIFGRILMRRKLQVNKGGNTLRLDLSRNSYGLHILRVNTQTGSSVLEFMRMKE